MWKAPQFWLSRNMQLSTYVWILWPVPSEITSLITPKFLFYYLLPYRDIHDVRVLNLKYSFFTPLPNNFYRDNKHTTLLIQRSRSNISTSKPIINDGQFSWFRSISPGRPWVILSTASYFLSFTFSYNPSLRSARPKRTLNTHSSTQKSTLEY
jgi:hypothetical protein